jgi:hypothetical protein
LRPDAFDSTVGRAAAITGGFTVRAALAAVSMATIACVLCHATRDVPMARTGAPRTPKRWKVLKGSAYCGACKHRAYMLRAVTLPVAGPEGASWPAFRAALREAWGEGTRCANWVMSELYARDVRRDAEDITLRKMPRIYLYPEARLLFPRLSPQTVASLVQQVQSAYRAHRYDLLWTGARALGTYRYPAPYPIPSQAWSLEERAGRWHVMLRLGHQRWDLRLRGGPHMRYQAARLRQIATGEAEPGAATLYQVRVQRGSHRTGLTSADGPTRVMLKFAAWLPKTEAPDGAVGTMCVRTGSDALLSVAGHDWSIDATPLRNVLRAEARRRAGLAVNLKHERRHPRRRRQGLIDALGDLSRRSRLRVADACRTYAAHVAAYAGRQRVVQVEYDDRDRSALPHFPWEQLRTAIASKLDEQRIAFVYVNGPASNDASGDEASPDDEALAEMPDE